MTYTKSLVHMYTVTSKFILLTRNIIEICVLAHRIIQRARDCDSTRPGNVTEVLPILQSSSRNAHLIAPQCIEPSSLNAGDQVIPPGTSISTARTEKSRSRLLKTDRNLLLRSRAMHDLIFCSGAVERRGEAQSIDPLADLAPPCYVRSCVSLCAAVHWLELEAADEKAFHRVQKLSLPCVLFREKM